MKRNYVKTAIKSGQPVLGAMVKINSPQIIEIVGHTKFNFVVLDLEHGFLKSDKNEDLVRAAELTGLSPFIRIPEPNANLILQNLDLGVQGIHFSQVETKQQASDAVSFCKYPPKGTRGLAFSNRGMYYGLRDKEEYLEYADKEIMIVISIESIKAINNLPSILEVEGIDVIFIGRADLAASLGTPGQSRNPKVQDACNEIISICKKTKMPLGCFVQSEEMAMKYIYDDFKYIIYGSDVSYVVTQCENIVGQFNKLTTQYN